MRILVDSLKRMYGNGLKDKTPSVTKEKVAERVAKGSISADEYKYITGEEYSGGESE